MAMSGRQTSHAQTDTTTAALFSSPGPPLLCLRVYRPRMGFRTDKVEHGYLPEYLRLAAKINARYDTPVVVELGVRDGASMELWEHLFPTGIIIGVDNSPHAYRDTPRTTFIHADMTDPALPEVLADAIGSKSRFGDSGIDLLVDDAGHIGKESEAAFVNLWPMVADGGRYIIEDWFVGLPSHPEYDDSMLWVLDLPRRLDHPAERGPYRRVTFEHGLCIVTKRE